MCTNEHWNIRREILILSVKYLHVFQHQYKDKLFVVLVVIYNVLWLQLLF